MADVDTTVPAVRDAGGTVVLEPMDVFDLGRFAVAADPGGAVFQLWQARSFAGAGLFNAPGALGWVELMTRTPDLVTAFYTTVFGWTVNASEHYTQWGIDGADFGGMVAMGDKFPHEVPSHWLPYFAVEDVEATAERSTQAGGGVLMEPTSEPQGPRIAVVRDPQGAVFGVYGRATRASEPAPEAISDAPAGAQARGTQTAFQLTEQLAQQCGEFTLSGEVDAGQDRRLVRELLGAGCRRRGRAPRRSAGRARRGGRGCHRGARPGRARPAA